MILALAMERKFSKQQILELYLNRVYFGGGAYGIDAAARKFFGHSADRLTLGEAAIIAGLVKAPSNYSPTADAAAAVGRAKVVIALMREQGKISAAEEASADPAAVPLAPEPKQNSVRYFTDWALAQLDTLVDETSEPIEVWTTLDLGMQRAADAAIRANTPPGTQGRAGRARPRRRGARDGGRHRLCLVDLQPRDAGGAPAGIGVQAVRLSRGARSRAQARGPGGRRAGRHRRLAPAQQQRPQSPARWTSAPPSPSRSTRSPPSSAREVGFDTVADMARRFGITTPVDTHPSMVLGTSDVRLIDMTRAFAAVGAEGHRGDALRHRQGDDRAGRPALRT